MNLLEVQQKLVTEQAHKIAQYEDTAVYGYLIGMISFIETRGHDPADYELVYIENEYPEKTESGFRITKRLRVRKFQ